MSNMLSKQQLAEILLQLLERTSFPREQMQNYVNRLFETFKWDGVPYVESRKILILFEYTNVASSHWRNG